MSAATMIGRRAELAALTAAWDAAAGGVPTWRFVGGDAGMGKTTLLTALAAAVGDDALTVTGQCVPQADEGLPLVPISQVLRRLVDEHGRAAVLDHAGAGRSSLGVLLPDLGTPAHDGEERLRLFEAFAHVLEGTARARPLLVVIEDLHWADATTRDLLRFCKVAVTGVPLLVVASFRTDEITRRHPLRPWLTEMLRTPGTDRLDLTPLDDAEAHELVGRHLGPDAEPHAATAITERAEGVPYFLAELAHAGARDDDLPWTLRDALLVRVHGLPESTQAVLRLASGAGNRVDHRLLAAVHDGDETALDGDLRVALDAHVLVADDSGYAFRHALLREAVHDDVLPGEHTRLHARYADAIEADPTLAAPGQLIHHLFSGARLDRGLRAAIDLARAETLPVLESLALLERVLETWDRVPDAEAYAGPRHRVLEDASRAALGGGLAGRGLRYAEAARDALPPDADPLDRAYNALRRGRALSNLTVPGASQAYQEAYAVPDGPHLIRLEALAQLSNHAMLRGDGARGLTLADEAIAEADALPPSRDRDEHRSRVILVRGLVRNGLGDEATFERDVEQARALADATPSNALRHHINYSDGLFVAGHFARAAEAALQGMGRAAELGLERSLGSMLAGNAALPLLMLGEHERARALVDRALALHPPEKFLLQLDVIDAMLRLFAGDLDGAERALSTFRGPRLASARYYPQYAVDLAQAAAALALERGDHAAVDARLLDTLGLDDARGTSLWLTAALAARSRRERGLDVRAGLAGVDALPRTRIVPAWRALLAAEAADTAEAWRAAVDHPLAEVTGAHTRAYARLQLARTLADADEARREWAAGRADAARAGHRPLVAAYDALGTRTGLAATAQATLLTPREREVIALVAEGLSNGEIAARLVISAKTASVHVSNILAKLGATSRTQAAMEAGRRGLV